MTLKHLPVFFASTMKHAEVTCYLQSNLNGPNPEAKSLVTVTESVPQLTWAIAALVWAAGGAGRATPIFTSAYRHVCSVLCPSVSLPNVCYPEVSNAEVPGNLPQRFVTINVRNSLLMNLWIHKYVQQVIVPFPFTAVFYLKNITSPLAFLWLISTRSICP